MIAGRGPFLNCRSVGIGGRRTSDRFVFDVTPDIFDMC